MAGKEAAIMIEIVPGYDRLEDVRKLFAEYTEMLISLDSSFHIYLQIQHYEEEKMDPSVKYRMPDGRLYLALSDGRVAGCIALRRLNDRNGELKRLFVRPEYRGRGIARQLSERIISDACGIGYDYLYLDTLPELACAVKLYEKLGFEYTDCYNDSPMDKTIFMRKKLEVLPLSVH